MQPPVLALTWLPRLLVRFLSRCERRTRLGTFENPYEASVAHIYI